MKKYLMLLGVVLTILVAACSKKDKQTVPGKGGGEVTNLTDPQLYLVKGKVVDLYTGDPIAGALVQRKASSNGTATDASGNFSLLVAFGPSERMVISFTGYETKELGLTGTTDFGVINLKPNDGPE